MRSFGPDTFLSPLTRDVQYLEQTGVFFPVLSQYLKGTQPRNKYVGRFSVKFIAKNFCRRCLIGRTEIKMHKGQRFQVENNRRTQLICGGSA